jgi:putative oxidoreductase
MFRKLIATSPVWAALPLRLALGAVFIAHGGQKVFGLFGGKGLAAWMANEPPFPFMHPAWIWMGAAAFAEFLGALLVLVGLATRLGALLIALVMLTAVIGVHLHAGFFAPRGYEYPMALFAMALALLIAGGGQASIDLKMSRGRRR